MTLYSCGFMFSDDFKYVVLIRKNKPEFQKGKLNGVGGKREMHTKTGAGDPWEPGEPGTSSGVAYTIREPALDAMIREFEEEAGVYETDWKPFVAMGGPDFEVEFFSCTAPLEILRSTRTVEAEEVIVMRVEDALKDETLLSNLTWLIPLAIDTMKDSSLLTTNVFYE